MTTDVDAREAISLLSGHVHDFASRSLVWRLGANVGLMSILYTLDHCCIWGVRSSIVRSERYFVTTLSRFETSDFLKFVGDVMFLETQRGQPGLCGECWRPPTWHKLRRQCQVQLSNVLIEIDACCFCLTYQNQKAAIPGRAHISRLAGNRATSDACSLLSF